MQYKCDNAGKMKHVISAHGLFKNYGKIEALKGINLEVEPGKIYGILGPNGAGKTTLIKTLVGAVKPTSGSAQVLEYDMPRHARKIRSHIGYMPQKPALYEDLTVRSNILFFAKTHGLDFIDQKVDQVLEIVGLEKLSNRQVSTLSGGYKQRCSLACALVHEPKILFLDEPTAGVDPVLKESFWRHFRSLAKSGGTIVISTHLMDEPLLCDRIVILLDGRLIIEDKPENILAKGKTSIVIETDADSFTAQTQEYSEYLPQILSKFGLAKEIKRISIKNESLEEVFLRLVREQDK
jgi:ABC-2 type transport system ATP-binding protein